MTQQSSATKKVATRSYTDKTLKVLFALSGNQCAEPSCTQPVILPPKGGAGFMVLGRIAHIYAFSERGPRGKAGLTAKQLNAVENLLLLCPSHHDEVDGQHQRFPATTLLEWKARQEAKATEDLTRSISDLGYAELEVAAQAVAKASPSASTDGLAAIPPADKIIRNGLGSHPAMMLSMGAAKSLEVEKVLLQAAQLDPDFPKRMTAGFVEHYQAQKRLGLSGDDLFYEMYEWAGGGGEDRGRQAAGLCILSHLFILCDVFEK